MCRQGCSTTGRKNKSSKENAGRRQSRVLSLPSCTEPDNGRWTEGEEQGWTYGKSKSAPGLVPFIVIVICCCDRSPAERGGGDKTNGYIHFRRFGRWRAESKFAEYLLSCGISQGRGTSMNFFSLTSPAWGGLNRAYLPESDLHQRSMKWSHFREYFFFVILCTLSVISLRV